ncbi:MAG: PadR family transcriptional regulator [Leptospirales bacterium]|nr:PadR family transcriptional regulator [Leptospirales bacterium]
MALSHSILATLVGKGRPCSGYDLAKEFNSSVGFYWKTTHQQIYRELAKLETAKMVESELVKQKYKPDKKLYTVTSKGRKHLIEWIALPSKPTPIKEDMLIKMYVGYLVPVNILIEEIEELKKIHEERLKLFRAYEKKFFSDIKSLSEKGKYRYLNLRSGISFEIGRIDWCNEAIEFLSSELK